MNADPVGSLLERAAGGELDHASDANIELLQRSASFLIEASYDRQRIRETLRALEHITRTADAEPSPPGAAGFRAAALAALESVARALLAHDPPSQAPPPQLTQRLAAAVLAKKHVVRILRLIAAQGDARFVGIARTAGLKDTTVSRVLSWAMSNGLLQRWADEPNVHYRLSALGETVLETIDEPQWVPMAATLIRMGVRQQMLARDGEDWGVEDPTAPIVQRASMLTGLSPEQAARSLNGFSRALQAAAVSNLAAALRFTPYETSQAAPEVVAGRGTEPQVNHGIIVSPPVFHWPFTIEEQSRAPELTRRKHLWAPRLDSLAEALVVRTMERSGIPPRILREVLPHHYLRATKQRGPYHLPLERPIIAMGSPELSPVTAGLLFEYGVPVYLRHRSSPEILWQQGNAWQSFRTSGDHDHGLVLRIFDEHTGATHFVLTGLRPSGTYAACRYFFDNAEELLERFPEQSFAAVLRVPRSYGRRKQFTEAMAAQPVDTRASAGRNTRLDMRYVEALSLLAEALQSTLGRQRVRRDLEGALHAAGNFAERESAGALARSGLEEGAPLPRRVRDTAAAYTLLGRFEHLVALLARDALAKGTGEQPYRTPAGDEVRAAQQVQQLLRLHAGLSKYAAGAVARLLVRDGEGGAGLPRRPRTAAHTHAAAG
jgi:DNA-binding HxlR family transcriptional regulator